jgi:hypothetical protein
MEAKTAQNSPICSQVVETAVQTIVLNGIALNSIALNGIALNGIVLNSIALRVLRCIASVLYPTELAGQSPEKPAKPIVASTDSRDSRIPGSQESRRDRRWGNGNGRSHPITPVNRRLLKNYDRISAQGCETRHLFYNHPVLFRKLHQTSG